jgi:hypothetical protein
MPDDVSPGDRSLSVRLLELLDDHHLALLLEDPHPLVPANELVGLEIMNDPGEIPEALEGILQAGEASFRYSTGVGCEGLGHIRSIHQPQNASAARDP